MCCIISSIGGKIVGSIGCLIQIYSIHLWKRDSYKQFNKKRKYYTMANYKIEAIEGISSAFGQKLREAGIKTTDELLKATKTKKQRKELASATGINEDKILKWANHVDLFRIQGVGAQYAELLEAAGVDTVKELANRNTENLVQKMEEVNNSKKLVRRIPPLKSVQKWIEAAKALPRGLEY